MGQYNVESQRKIEQLEELTSEESKWLQAAIEECCNSYVPRGKALTHLPHRNIAKRLGMETFEWRRCFVQLSKKFKGLQAYLCWVQDTEQASFRTKQEPTRRKGRKAKVILDCITESPELQKLLTKKQQLVVSTLCSGLQMCDVLYELGMSRYQLNLVLKNIDKKVPGFSDRLEQMGLLDDGIGVAEMPFTDLPSANYSDEDYGPFAGEPGNYEKSITDDGYGEEIHYRDGGVDRAVQKF